VTDVGHVTVTAARLFSRDAELVVFDRRYTATSAEFTSVSKSQLIDMGGVEQRLP